MKGEISMELHTKEKVSKNAIKEEYPTIIAVECGAMQSLLHFQTPFAYSVGRDGWHCDYYNVDGIIISTGRKPIGAIKVAKSPTQLRYYENSACVTLCNSKIPIKYKETQVNKLLRHLVHQLVCAQIRE